MKRIIFPIAAVAILAIFGSCAGSQKSESDSAQAAADAAQQNLVELPDTAYESVSIITSKTSIVDTVTDGNLNNLADLYANTPGVFCFRTNAYRNADMYGKVTGTPKEIVVDWTFTTSSDNRQTGSSRSWGGGSGWTGQPVYVEWPDSLLKKYRSLGHLSNESSGKEIIVGSLAANLYFIDFQTGKEARKPVYVGNPIKGSIMMDPTLNGNIYVGHGIPNERPFGAIVVNLAEHQVTHTYGEDKNAPRHWGAYDSNPIRAGQFLFRCGENGMIYKFNVEPGNLTLHSTMSYTVPKVGGPGIEASMAVYRNYGYTADNYGYIVCTNLNTMKPVWVFDLSDDTDCTPVVIEEDGVPYVYLGNEIDKIKEGKSRFVKLNGLDGSVVWERNIEGRRADWSPTRHFDGGFYSTTLPGTGNCSDLLFTNVVLNTSGQNGRFIAINRKNGEVVYEVPTKYYAWSSPVGFLNEKNEMFVLAADCSGNMYIINGKTGEILNTTHVGNNFESSPVVVGNSAVVGSRGSTIYKVSLK